MITQIIFFLALGAFIILLARRYSSQKIAGSITSSTTVSGKRSLSNVLVAIAYGLRKFGAALFSGLTSISPKKINISKVKLGLNKKPKSATTPPADNEFWQEESFSHKAEISSHFEEGEDLMGKGKVKEAEQFFLKAAANNPSDAKVYAKLGLLYLNQKNYSDAIEALKMAVKLEKYNPSRHYNLALAYWGNKDTRRAIASAREAISLDPVTPKYRKLLEELLNG